MRCKKFWCNLIACCILIAGYTAQSQTVDLIKYVQPLSGTSARTTPSALKHGDAGTEKFANTIPAVGLPFGMTQWTPQTRLTEVKCQPPYLYKDSIISGFRATHWISGSCTQDYGSFTIMPITGKLKTSVNEYACKFSHKNEIATPAFYSVSLPKYKLNAKMTATARCGMMEFTMQTADSLYLLITSNSDREKGFVQINKDRGEVCGYNPVHRIYQGWGEPAGFSGYFVIKIEKAIGRSGTFSGTQIFTESSIIDKKDLGAYLGFGLKAGEKLRIKIGTSFSSIEGARKNLQAEIPNWSFENLLSKNKLIWQKALGQIKIEEANERSKRIFYTAMYHSMQHPRLYNDVDGTYPKFSGKYQNEHLQKGNYYDDFSMWDTYRAQLPLYQLLKPELINDFVRSLILKGQQGTWLPIFPCWNSYTAAMIGDHCLPFIASAYTKGIRDYDVNEAYRLMRKNAFEIAREPDYKNGMGRRALYSYLKWGYIPMEDSVPDAFHKKEQVSRTMEYAYDDYALAEIAKIKGNKSDYELLKKRSLNYQNIFDTSTGMVRGRSANGDWYTPFRPDTRESYITEGTPRQYTFYVPHDVPGLAKLMGGKNKLEQALDSLFEKNEYWHGNEPGHQIPFMYNYTASPWKTQREVRKILAEEYSDGPGGLSGNDDAGQMSAWYIFAALGMYPVDPVSNQYMLSAPLYNKATIQFGGGKKFFIIVYRTLINHAYISKVVLNGKPLEVNYIDHKSLIEGGKLEIWLQEKPSLRGRNN